MILNFDPASRLRLAGLRGFVPMCGWLRVGKENLHVAGLVGVAMCSACLSGTHDRWPQCPPRIRSRSNPAFKMRWHVVGCPDGRIDPALHYVLFALPTITSRRMSGVISFTPRARWVGVADHGG